MTQSIEIKGLGQFRKALKEASSEGSKQLTVALKAAGAPIVPTMKSLAPHRTGRLAASVGNPAASGKRARIPVRVPYAGIIEFAKAGRLGATLSSRYGSPPRFGYRAVEKEADRVVEILDRELKDILTAYGWLHG